MSALSAKRSRRAWRSKAAWVFALAAGVLVAFRAGSHGRRPSALRDLLRRFNRRWFNPLALRIAGAGPWPLARLEHRGRRSGASRVTPVLAWPVEDGFVVPMPYGTDVDWARNLLHAGGGVLQVQGVRYRVGGPRVGSILDILGDSSPALGRLVASGGVRHAMRLDILPSLTTEGALPS